MKIFISYRRDDEPGIADRFYESFKTEFGKDNVFFDIDSGLEGHRFQSKIEEAIGNSDWFIPLIGQFWLVDRNGINRVSAPVDYVRMELSEALSRHPSTKIFPVMIGNVDIQKIKASGLPYSQLVDFDCEKIRFGNELRDDINRIVSRVSGAFSKPEITENALEEFFFGDVGLASKVYAEPPHGSAGRDCYLSSLATLAESLLNVKGVVDQPISQTLIAVLMTGNAGFRFRDCAYLDQASIQLFSELPSRLQTLTETLDEFSRTLIHSGNHRMASHWGEWANSIREFRHDYVTHFQRNHKIPETAIPKVAMGTYEVTKLFPDDTAKVESLFAEYVNFSEDRHFQKIKVKINTAGGFEIIPGQGYLDLRWQWLQRGRRIAILWPQPYRTFWGWLGRYSNDNSPDSFEVHCFEESKGIVPSEKLRFRRCK